MKSLIVVNAKTKQKRLTRMSHERSRHTWISEIMIDLCAVAKYDIDYDWRRSLHTQNEKKYILSPF